jgi:hypothetical protein
VQQACNKPATTSLQQQACNKPATRPEDLLKPATSLQQDLKTCNKT